MGLPALPGLCAVSGRASRQKGDRLERLIVGIFDAAGLDAKRIPLSGSVEGFEGDIRLTIGDRVLTGECKSRAKAFPKFYRWLEGNDFLAIKQDRMEPLVIIEARKLATLLAIMPRQATEKAVGEASTNPPPNPSSIEQQPTSIPFETDKPPEVVFHGGKPSVRW